MNKSEFLNEIKSGLSGLPQTDVDERLAFYSEMIDDRIEEGLTEDEAVSQTGAPERIIQQIVADYPINKLVRKKIRPEHSLKAWETVLIVLGFPLWLPLLIAVFATVFSVYVCIWAVILSLWAVEVSLWVCAVCGFAAAVIFFIRGFVLQALAILGASIFLAGFSVLFFIICKGFSKGIIKLTKRVAFALKSRLIKREAAK